MAVKIRLARAGAKKRPFYHIVAADARSPRDGNFIEKLGTYNPMLPKDSADRVKLNNERIAHWLKVGAQATDRVAFFIGKAGLAPMPKQANNPDKAQPKAKAQARIKEANAAAEAAKAAAEAEKQAAKDAAEAAKAAAAAPAPTPEAVAEAAPEAAAEETAA